MLLIHDLVEIDAGDTYAYDEEAKKTELFALRKKSEIPILGAKAGVNKVNIKIDASRVTGLITGTANLDKVSL